jgi:uncharacterized membrane protein
MEVFGILFLIAVVVFFLIGVPWMAVTGRREAITARQAINGLTDQIGRLQLQIDQLRARSGVANVAVPEAPAAPVRKARATARTAAAGFPAVLTEPAVAAELPTTPLAAKQSVADPVRAPVSAGAAEISRPAPRKDLEELIGTRWAIWVGGLALALGSLFLVRYTIEAGFFGPRARLVMGGLFSLALIGVGELLRRGLVLPRKLTGQMPVEHAPLALTAAGTVGLFGTVYAAYALYGFLSQTAAFALLGLIGVAAMAASVVHGQALAGLGLVASYATPVLIGGESESRWPVVVFLLAVTAAGLAVQNRIRSLWLGWAVVVGVAIWTALLIGAQKPAPLAELTFMLAAMALFAGAFLILRRPGYPQTPVGDPMALTALAGLAAALGLSFAVHAGAPGLHAVFAAAAIALVVAAAVGDARAALAIVAAGLLPLGMILTWPSDTGAAPALVRIIDGAFMIITSPPRAQGVLAALASGAAAILTLPPLALFFQRFSARVPHGSPALMALAITGGLAAPALAFAWSLRQVGLTQNLTAAAILAVLTAALAIVTDRLLKQADGPVVEARKTSEIGAGGYGAGASLALGLAIALALPGLWMAVGFSVAGLAAAALNDKRPLPMLRRVTAAFATTAILRAVTSPVLQQDGAWPVLNSYIIAYGLPVMLLGAAAWLLIRQSSDRNVKVTLAAAGLMAAVYTAYTIRHAFHGGDLVDFWRFGLGESGLYVLACLVGCLGLVTVREKAGEASAATLRKVIAGVNVVALALLVILVLLVANPWLQPGIAGPPFLDSTLVGFLLPALALGALAYFGRIRPEGFSAETTIVNRTLAIGLGYLYVLAQTRRAFVGAARFIAASVGEAEHYAYSAVTLAFGVVLLAIGFRLGSRPTRLASAVFVTLAALKAFLFDMAELTGLFRALSFIGLGVVLIGIGLAYQRLLFDRKPVAEEASLPADKP